jgi:hypothetical protein
MRYFFDIRDGENLTDEVGVEHPSEDVAMQEAARAAVAIAEDDLVPRGGGILQIQVREFERQIGTVTISLDIKKSAKKSALR